VSVLRGILRIA
jgi:hypothetical protein